MVYSRPWGSSIPPGRSFLGKSPALGDFPVLDPVQVDIGAALSVNPSLAAINTKSPRPAVVVIKRAEVLGGNLDILQDSFEDGDTRNNDDELLETVLARKLKDGAKVDVGFACARRHGEGRQ